MKTTLRKIGILIAVLLGFLSAYSYDFEVDGIYYNIVSLPDLTCEVTYAFDGNSSKYYGDIDIPSEVTYNNKTLTVVSIGASAFFVCDQLVRVTIPNSVISIGDNAFKKSSTEGIESLTNVKIGESVISIGKNAFQKCTSLRDLTIPNSVTTIGEYAFDGCSNLEYVSMGESISSIERETFSNCYGLTSIIIPNSVTSIGSNAFSNCQNLSSVSIGQSVISIEGGAFRGCKSLTDLIIPDNVISIGNSSFSGCSELVHITLGESVSSIGSEAFRGCVSLTSIVIPNSVIYIGSYAFYDCKHMVQIELSNKLTKLNNSLFSGCNDLESITIPGSVSEVEWNNHNGGLMFKDCMNLKEMSFLYGESILEVGALVSGTTDNYLNYYIPLGLERLYIDRKLSYLRECQFAFRYVKEATLGSHITECPYGIVAYSDNLEVITCYSLEPPKASSAGEFSNSIYMNCILKVPQQALEAYRQADIWKNFWNIEGFEYSGIDAEIISLNIQVAELNIGETVQLEATVLPEDTTDKTLEWTSSDESVATVDSEGNVKAIGLGTASIRATSKSVPDVYAECSVTVTPVYIESIILDPSEWHGEVGEEFSIIATVIPENASNITLEWSSSNSEIATVKGDGIVVLLKEGDCIITAKATDGSGVQATCIIDTVSSVDEFFEDETVKIYVFDTHGLLIREGYGKKILDNLEKGVYIIRQGKTTKRIIVSNN